MNVKVSRMRNVEWEKSPNVLATVDYTIMCNGQPGITVKDAKLINGEYGMFVGAPSKKLDKPFINEKTGKETSFLSVVFHHKPLDDEINNVVSQAYDSTKTPFDNWYAVDSTLQPTTSNNTSTTSGDILDGIAVPA